MALLNLVDQVSNELDNKKYSVDIYIDLSRALDTFDHNILISKHDYYGVTGASNKLFVTYLENRKQLVLQLTIVILTPELLNVVSLKSPFLVLCYLFYV